ncbi:MAG: hypothetical protein WB542_01140 [Polaromonas sp.]
MRAVFSVIGLLILLAVVGVLAKKQLSALSVAPVGMQGPAAAVQTATLPATSPGAMPEVQSRQIQQQIKQTVEAAMQQPRPMPDD